MFIVVGKRLMRTQASDINVCISGVAIPYVDKIKYLGVSLSAIAIRLMSMYNLCNVDFIPLITVFCANVNHLLNLSSCN